MGGVIFVTGATGYLGAWLVQQLLAEGSVVHALVRKPLGAGPVHGHVGDVANPASLERALAAAHADAAERGAALDAIHGAAVISYANDDRERLRSVNVEGTWNVLAACRRAGVRRVLHVGSVVAYGPSAPGGRSLPDERAARDTARERDLKVAYVTTKRAAEEVALGMTGELDVRVVDPGAIFGPRSRPVPGAPIAREPNTLRFLRRAVAGRLGPFAPPGALSVVDVRDVAGGCLLALRHGRRGERYALAVATYDFPELFAALRAALIATGHAARREGGSPQVSLPRIRIGYRAWRAARAATVVLERLGLGGSELTAASVAMLGERFVVDAARARRPLAEDGLGWAPRPFDETLIDSLADLAG